MSLLNHKPAILVFLFLFFASHSIAQIQIGASYGGTYDFGKNIPNSNKTIGTLVFELLYQNQSTLSPFISVGFTKIPLNYSEALLANQGRFRTEIVNNSTTAEMGIEALVKNYLRFDLYARFGVGLNFLSNPSVWLYDSREGMGNESDYTKGTETKFPFLDFALRADKGLSKHWTINFNIGTEYYPKDSSVSVTGKVIETDYVVNSSFTKVRPYAKIGLAYSIKENAF